MEKGGRETGGRVRRILLYGREREGDEREDFDDGRVDRRLVRVPYGVVGAL